MATMNAIRLALDSRCVDEAAGRLPCFLAKAGSKFRAMRAAERASIAAEMVVGNTDPIAVIERLSMISTSAKQANAAPAIVPGRSYALGLSATGALHGQVGL